MTFFQSFYLLCLILFFKSFAILSFILYGDVGLGPDEAQYWTWSQFLDWGYYSKPPGIAWQIALGTHIFGNTELGVRFGSLMIGFALPLSVFFLAKTCRLQPWTAFWSGITMAFCPLGFMSSFLAITDGGIVLFWTIACILFVSTNPHFYWMGLLVLCGALFKWQIYYFWLFVILFHQKIPNFKWKHLAGGIGISLLGLIPSFIWNIQHQWATFRHVAGNMKVEEHSLLQGNFWAFLGEQTALLSPILFILLLFAFFELIRKGTFIPKPIWICGTLSLVILATHCLIALFKKMQGNWCDYAYPTAIVFMCWYLCENVLWGKLWLKLGLAFSVAISILGLMIPQLPIPYKMNPFKHNLGWHVLGSELNELGYNPEEHFLFSDKYQTSSILSFYSEGQKRAYFLNLHQIRNNQFSYWPSMAAEQQGKAGYFVITENSPHKEKNFPFLKKEYEDLLQNYFEEVHYLGEYPLFYNRGEVVKAALIFKCIGYNGKEVKLTNLF